MWPLTTHRRWRGNGSLHDYGLSRGSRNTLSRPWRGPFRVIGVDPGPARALASPTLGGKTHASLRSHSLINCGPPKNSGRFALHACNPQNGNASPWVVLFLSSAFVCVFVPGLGSYVRPPRCPCSLLNRVDAALLWLGAFVGEYWERGAPGLTPSTWRWRTWTRACYLPVSSKICQEQSPHTVM